MLACVPLYTNTPGFRLLQSLLLPPSSSLFLSIFLRYDYSVRVGLPYRHVQIDSWWYIKGASKGTKTWSPAPNTFPPVPGGSAHSGLERLHNKTGWVYTAHNRMWAGDTTYAKQNGGDFDFLVEGGTALPMTEVRYFTLEHADHTEDAVAFVMTLWHEWLCP